MTKHDLFNQIQVKKSFLCLGLDPDIEKMPSQLIASSEEPLFDFCKQIVDGVHPLCVAVKINTAFFEAFGETGFASLSKLIYYIKSNYPDLFTIADSKRGDIGNTSLRYAKAFFEAMPFDSITISPYMGKDSIEPFLLYKDKHAILLALTSNQGAADFQFSENNEKSLFKKVIATSLKYDNADRLMYVVGATKADYLKEIRNIVPNAFLLIPGVGAQGGGLKDVFENGVNKQVGLLVNSSRSILYASKGEDYVAAAFKVAASLQNQMEKLLT